MNTARNRGIALLAVAATALIFPQLLHAQAWLPEQGSFSTSLTYGNTYNKKHYEADGSEVDLGHTRVNTVGAILAYSPTDRLMLAAGIPYVRSRYDGDFSHPGEIDNGEFHSTFTDLRLDLHFQATLEPIALAPYVAYVLPTTDYVTLGHAAPGRGLEELWLGFYAAKSLDLWIPQTYIQVRYNYAFVEEVVGIHHDRSNVDLEIGYFLNPAWSVRALGSWQDTHGGIDVPIPRTNPLFPYHDQLVGESYLHVGAGATWGITSRIGMFFVYMTSLSGKNGHKLDQGLTLGISYGIN